MAFTADQMQIIQIGIRTSALLSIILGIAVVNTYIRTERLKTQMNTLICFMTLADLLTASALFLGEYKKQKEILIDTNFILLVGRLVQYQFMHCVKYKDSLYRVSSYLLSSGVLRW
jgi:hypothetical protein